MRIRYEPFGGIIVLDRPAATIHVNRAWMRQLGLSPTLTTNGTLWSLS